MAKRLEIGAPEIQDYFTTVDDLVKHTTDWVIDFWDQKLRDAIQAPFDESESTEAILADCFRTSMEWSKDYARYVKFEVRLLYEMDLDSPIRAQYNLKGLNPVTRFFEQIIERGQQRGEMRLDLHAKVAAFWIVLMVSYMSDASVSPSLDIGLGMQGDDACEVTNATLDILLRGLEPSEMLPKR